MPCMTSRLRLETELLSLPRLIGPWPGSESPLRSSFRDMTLTPRRILGPRLHRTLLLQPRSSSRKFSLFLVLCSLCTFPLLSRPHNLSLLLQRPSSRRSAPRPMYAFHCAKMSEVHACQAMPTPERRRSDRDAENAIKLSTFRKSKDKRG